MFEGWVKQKEKTMATHSSTLAWKIPWTEEPGGLQSMGSLRVGMTEQLHFHFSLSCIGEGNGNPLQYSHLENPTDRGAWQATVHGIARVGHDLATKLPPPSFRFVLNCHFLQETSFTSLSSLVGSFYGLLLLLLLLSHLSHVQLCATP